MTYLASDLFSGTWENIVGPTASWKSDQNSAYRGFTVFVDGYGDEIMEQVLSMKETIIMNGDIVFLILI